MASTCWKQYTVKRWRPGQPPGLIKREEEEATERTDMEFKACTLISSEKT